MGQPRSDARAGLRSSASIALLTAAAAGGCAAVLGVGQTYVAADASTDARSPSGDGIRCGDAGSCLPMSQECCLSSSNTLSCVSTAGSPCPGGTDIVCDVDTCPQGNVCCLNLDEQTLVDSRCAQ